MESRFSHLRQRDSSVSMLRVRMSRRRSQAQKENRDRVVNTRRQLQDLQELDVSSMDTSVALTNVSLAPQPPKNEAAAERLKQLQKWKERKALEKEKEKREKGRKGVFKTGLYHPKDSLTFDPLPRVQGATGRNKETKVSAAPAQSTRVTRSMKQQVVQKPLKMRNVNSPGKRPHPPAEKPTRNYGAAPKPAQSDSKTKAEPAARGPSTRSASRPPVSLKGRQERPERQERPRDKASDVRTTRSRAVEVAPPPTEIKKYKDTTTVPCVTVQTAAPEQKVSEEEEMEVEQTIPDPGPGPGFAPGPDSAPVEDVPNSFAPEGFLFQAPVGVSSFKFDPMTPRSADAFLTPSSSFTLPSAPVFDDDSQEEKGKTDLTSEEPMHDVPYFRSAISSETDRLNALCAQWEPKVEDESIPEEMRDRMRTAVGQARLLMKERFHQFQGLVDDCEFCRGEKVTSCSDLQGFWDMVYFQVEDVFKKFEALKEAEARGWIEEHKPPPRQRKAVKKPTAAPVASKPAGTKASAKSRLAAAKAAMKARQKEESQEVLPETTDTGGFTQVQSPKDSVRRSSRLSSVALPPPSPSSNLLTPRRTTRRSLALAQTPAQTISNPQLTTPSLPATRTPAQTPRLQASPVRETSPDAPQSHSPVKETSSDAPQSRSPVKESSPDASEDIDPAESIPSVAVEDQDEASEVLPESPCRSPPESSVPPASLSFCLSPCAVQMSSPTVRCSPAQDLLRTPEPQDTPDSFVDEVMPGVDFERYLQPSLRDSLSPRKSLPLELPLETPLETDVEMDSPRGPAEHPLPLQEPVSCSLLTISAPTPVSSQSPQTAASSLLLFTPDLKDRIRQSVCPSDLMVFTPPQ